MVVDYLFFRKGRGKITGDDTSSRQTTKYRIQQKVLIIRTKAETLAERNSKQDGLRREGVTRLQTRIRKESSRV